MIGALYYRLQILEFEEYVARQTGDKEKHKQIKAKINRLVKQIKKEVAKGNDKILY